jgi:elongation factor P
MITCKISSIKKGIFIKYNNEIYKIINFAHVKVAQGPAFIKLTLKHIIQGFILNKNFLSGHSIKQVIIKSYKHQFIYKTRYEYCFMNIKNFEQFFLDKSLLKIKFLKEGVEVDIFFIINHNKKCFSHIKMPSSIILTVKKTEIAVKGDSVTNHSTKTAILETNDTIQVPLFINVGEKIKINILKEKYIERIKL